MKKLFAPNWASEIKALRGELPQTEFATKIGIERSTLQNWENGRAVPRRRTIQRVRAICASANSDGHSASHNQMPPPPLIPGTNKRIDQKQWDELCLVADEEGKDVMRLLYTVIEHGLAEEDPLAKQRNIARKRLKEEKKLA